VAKPLAFGVAPYWTLLGGFTATIIGFIAVTQYCEKRRVDAHHHMAPTATRRSPSQ